LEDNQEVTHNPQAPPETPPKPVKRGRGQPTKYRKEYCDLLLKHFDLQPSREVETIKSGKNWEVREKKLLPNRFPTFEDFAWNIGTVPQTLSEWANEHPDFWEAMTRAHAKQKSILMQGGLEGCYEARTVNFVGINCCGMSNRIEIDATVGAGERLTDEKVRQIAQEAARVQLRGVIDVPRITSKSVDNSSRDPVDNSDKK
jgi:hypothetical protein